MGDSKRRITSPSYLVTSDWHCWRCGAPMQVVAVLCENTDAAARRPFILQSTATLPDYIVEFIQRRCPTFRLTYSKVLGSKYLANNCPKCNVISGDHFLHGEPGAPFFPTEEHEARSLTLEPLPITEPVQVNSGYGYGVGELILENARRIVRNHEPNPDNPIQPTDEPES